jgi:hypothetical protein
MDVIDTVRNTLSVYAETDVRSLLAADHEAMCDLARDLVEASTASTRRDLVERLHPLVAAHSRAEQETVYAALTRIEDASVPRVIGYEGEVEHQLVDVALAWLAARTDANADQWRAHAKVLHDLVDRHVCDEENKTFEEIGERLSVEEREVLARDFAQRRGALLAAKVAARSPD